ncbi:AraC family transcriptional regulator [Lacrimispora amygdalina]|uniref:AraC family transcriptional regulator n=1 Tax=Lacrimispora amygdalina TaxID=253257 RepID=UPI000BE39611|nr:AraC family transcriptional regulator [Lacrimispora amygdalina]
MKGRFNLRQWAALMTAVILTVVFFSSSFFVFTHLSHECTGSHCKVCQELEVCISAISVISEAIGTAAVVFIACQITNYRILPYIAGLFLRPVSLVDLKVRMDN